MAAMSTVQTATTLTPPSSSHDNGNGFSWDFTSAKPENQHLYGKNNTLKLDATNGVYRSPLLAQHGNSSAYTLDTSSKASNGGDLVNGPGALSRSYSDEDDDMLDDRPDNVVNTPWEDAYSPDGRSVHSLDETTGQRELTAEESNWIHRDKLVKIENEELQAAGLYLPQPRSRSRPSRDRSQSSTKRLNYDHSTRSRKNSTHAMEPKTPDTTEAMNGWDWRVGTDEMDADGDTPAKHAGGSRIPIPKKSPLPIPTQHLERDRLMKRENSPEELEKRADNKSRSRSNSTTLKSLEPSPHLKVQPGKRSATMDASPKKPSPTGPRKGLPPSKTIPPEARGKVKPKGKNGANGTRPSTRSGDRELSSGSIGSKPMEGDPPWMVSAYKPDPRLPPDQQLLPTVARRLQQEKWEQEGKFGNVYDKDFRPLTDEGYLSPPQNASNPPNPSDPSDPSDPSEPSNPSDSSNMPSSSSENENIVEQEAEKPAEDWPLKSPETSKSPRSPARSSSYSTMPRIQDNPHFAPLASPKPPAAAAHQPEPTQITRVPDMPEEKETGKKEKGGCGCCIVM
ncbi:hypothetical protein VMCG_10243 [Cytospora schulzeri]|uniref:TeaA receptor TeaR n=1 Tax=Cytospora schulzeri TaxID=448051 RepID=A0A423VH00_9PEZI|nr:hypothetical protein VMCG_10243 [Valsa malicola]